MRNRIEKAIKALRLSWQSGRTRLIVLIVAVIVIFAIVIGVTRLTAGGSDDDSTQVASVPSDIDSVPASGKESQAYLQTLLKSNKQAATKAMQTGGSEVPTIAATPASAQGQDYQSQAVRSGCGNCCGNCCSQSQCGTGGSASSPKASVNSVLNQLESSGAVAPEVADQLRKLAAQGIPVSDYAKHLQQLVAEGKLTPAQAKALLAAYKAQHAADTRSPDDLTDSMLASGAISPDTAKTLKALNAKNLTPAQYAAALNRLVKEGKLSPAEAQDLMAAYQKQHTAASTPTTDTTAADTTAGSGTGPTPDALAQEMASSGQISPGTLSKLRALNSSNLSPDAYRSRLQQMVADGELTQAQADKLAAAYAAHHLGGTPKTTTGMLDQLQANGSINPQVAGQLKSLIKSGASPEQFANALKTLVASGQLDPGTAAKLLQNYIDTHPGDFKGGKGVRGLQAKQRLDALEQEVQDFNQQAQSDQQQANEETQKKLEQAETAMSGQVKQLVLSWKPAPQKYMDDTEKKKPGAAGAMGELGSNLSSAGGNNATAGEVAKIPAKTLIKAGDILFAVLDTSVNSDRPGPVMATIVAGKYKGAKLLGSLQITPDYERVVLSFTTMTMPKWPKAVSIQAVAINPDTAQTALASDVDHHYLLRYSALFASSFLQGYGEAVQNSGSTKVNSFGTISQTFNKTNTLDKAMIGLGQVGTNAGQAAADTFNRKPTVTVDSGVGVGILYTAGVTQPNFNSTQKVEEQTSNG